MNEKISVIVPIYKVEPYLRKCLDSICTQTYENLEIILVDDGSPDGCGAICDEYAARDGRVKVIHKPNGGLSDARNAGLEIMTGTYVTFVDSDDWLTEDAVSSLYDLAIQTGAELVIGSCDRVFDDSSNTVGQSSSDAYIVLDKLQAVSHFLHNGCAAWGRLYERRIHEDIFFPIGEINEDEAIILNVIDRCTSVVISEKVIYHYRLRNDSITTVKLTEPRLIWEKNCRNNLSFIEARYPALAEEAAEYYRAAVVAMLMYIAADGNRFSGYAKQFKKRLVSLRGKYPDLAFSSKAEKRHYIMQMTMPSSLYSVVLRTKRKVFRHET